MSSQQILLIVLTAVAIVVEIIFTPLFLKAQRPGISTKSRFYKMICATMFVCVGVLAVLFSGNHSDYALFMMIGLVFSWFGDLFLHIKGKKPFIVGFICFTTAHVFYLIAYDHATKQYFPERRFITWGEVLIFVVLEVSLLLFYTKVKKMSIRSVGIKLGIVYGFVLLPMMIKAAAFSLDFIRSGAPNAFLAGFLLTFGAFCFVLSDTSLLLTMFNPPDRKNIKLKNHNIATYFAAQTLLALTIHFIGV